MAGGQLRDGRKCSRCDGDTEGEKDEVEEDYLFSASSLARKS